MGGYGKVSTSGLEFTIPHEGGLTFKCFQSPKSFDNCVRGQPIFLVYYTGKIRVKRVKKIFFDGTTLLPSTKGTKGNCEVSSGDVTCPCPTEDAPLDDTN